MRAWVFDLDGVIWKGDAPIVNGVRAAQHVIATGADVLFVTNFSYSRLGDQEAKLDALGIAAHGRVVTSAMAAAELVGERERALVCAGPGVVEALEARRAEVVADGPADVVVVGFHPEFDYARLTAACRAVWAGARLVATNDDATYPASDGLLPGGGAILAAVVAATKVTPTVAGKPYLPMCEAVWRRLGRDRRAVVVGDRPDTDGRFARALGYEFALVLSGVTHTVDGADPAPDIVGGDALAVVTAGDDNAP
jgi:HAD superfamily hydrolase (TIGR01450 family)